jgi:threonine dehydrogenase-like Zn-dependent dehydrogenase
VLIVGGRVQSIGLYAAGAAVALGAGRVLYLDDHAERRQRAHSMGATAEPLGLEQGRAADEQFDIVVEAAGDARALDFAVRSCGTNGMLTIVSIHFGAPVPVPLARAYYKGLTLHTSRVNSRMVFPQALDGMLQRGFCPQHVTHRTVPFAQAGEAMTDPGPKLIFYAEGLS